MIDTASHILGGWCRYCSKHVVKLILAGLCLIVIISPKEWQKTMSSGLSFRRFLATPQGQLLSAWERKHFDIEVADVFGYDALQVGLPDLDTLVNNRISRHWISTSDIEKAESVGPERQAIVASPVELPFDDESFDLVTLPHTLDKSNAPQQVLREAARVLCPEGRLVITAFNPTSLWWLRQKTVSLGASPYLPSNTAPISPSRLKDWLGLLGFQIEHGYWGIYSPSCCSASSFKHWDWLNKAGDRWAPHCANLLMLSAVKRLSGVKLVGKVSTTPAKPDIVSNPAGVNKS